MLTAVFSMDGCDMLAEGVLSCREHKIYFDLCYFMH